MNDADELNLKLLERSLEEHEQARANFSRDLKIAVVLLLAFQFFVFFRFANLSDQQFELQPQLAEAEARQKALVTVSAAVSAIDTTLKTGTAELATFIDGLPQQIRNELAHLNEDLMEFRSEPFPPTRDDSPMRQQVQLPPFPNANSNALPPSVRNESKFFADLTYEESAELHAANPSNPVFRERIVRIVEHQIIQPSFEELNEHAEDLVGQPLASGLTTLRQQTAALAILKSTGADVDGWVQSAEQGVAMARGLKFSPPKEVDWWTSATAKGNFANAAKLDASRIAQEARTALSGPDAELKELAEKMESAITTLTQQNEQIKAELTKLKAHAASLETLIDGYAKPLALLALAPKDLVIFYPVILAAIVSTFLVRQVLLRRRAATLAHAYRELGASEEMLEVYFTELPVSRADNKTTSPSGWARSRRIVGWLWVVPAGFAIVSFAWVLASNSLAGDAPRFLYAVSALALVAACLVLLRSSREPLQAA